MEPGYINMKKGINWETSNSPFREEVTCYEQTAYTQSEPEPKETPTEPDQAPDNTTMMQFMRRCTERNVWQRFPILTKHFLTQFDQGKMSEAEMAEEVYLVTLEAERDEEISEEELIRTIYQPSAARRHNRARHPHPTPDTSQETKR